MPKPTDDPLEFLSGSRPEEPGPSLGGPLNFLGPDGAARVWRGDQAPEAELMLTYGRDASWPSDDGRVFDQNQERAAQDYERWLPVLEILAADIDAGDVSREGRQAMDHFVSVFGGNPPTGDDVRWLQDVAANNVRLLRGRHEDGYVARYMTPEEMQERARRLRSTRVPGEDTAMAVGRGTRELMVNGDMFGRLPSDIIRDNLRHEPNHGEGNAMSDQDFPAGSRIWAYRNPGPHLRAYNALPPARRRANPEHISAFFGRRPPRVRPRMPPY